MYDFIGDIHGYADHLEALLLKLGYSIKQGVYWHPERKAFFIGDYIDRGPKIRETLQIVRSMRDAGNAIALMGNHEYNALCFHYPETQGGHLRKHKIKNIIQHYETLKQFQNKQNEYEDYLNWFKTLPLFYETDEFRAVHACWESNNINYIKTLPLYNNCLNDEYIYESVAEGSKFNLALEETLKGKEIKIPEGFSFTDKDGEQRSEIRIKWWEDPNKTSYKQISVEPLESLPDTRIDISLLKNINFYSQTDKPVFFGHYWLKGNPSIYRKNICCLDYSVAKQGKLVAYRFDGEQQLDNSKLVFV